MRHFLTGLALLTVSACAAGVGQPTETVGETRARSGSSVITLRGVVRGPSALVAARGANLVNLDGGTLINLDGAGLSARLSLRYGLAQQGTAALAGVTIVAASAATSPLTNTTREQADAQGRFTLRVPSRGGTIVALAQTADGRSVRLFAVMHEASPDGEVEVSPATSLVTAPLVAALRGQPGSFARLDPGAWRTALRAAAPAAVRLTPDTLAAPAAILQAYEEAARTSAPLREAVGGLLANLATQTDVAEAPPPAPAQPAPASPRPTSPAPATPVPTPQAPATLATATPTPPTPTPTPAPSPSPRFHTVKVQSNHAVGGCFAPQDSKVPLAVGDRVTLTATGNVLLDPTSDVFFGPEGGAAPSPEPSGSCQAPLPQAGRGALIYGLAEAGKAPTAFQVVGQKAEFAVERAGTLYLGVNDAATANNEGTFTVTVTIMPAVR